MDAQKKNVSNWIIAAFALLCLVQLYLPLKMVAEQEAIVSKGKVFKFKVAPLDPNDPFRGKYITLRYQANSVKVKNVNEWMGSDPVFVILKTDSQGYAAIDSVAMSRPENTSDYVIARAGPINKDDMNMLLIEYPFSRFYMEETKALKAEKMFLQALRNPGSNTYAVVYIRGGKALIHDVLIDKRSVNEL